MSSVLTLSEIARMVGYDRQTVQYHLRQNEILSCGKIGSTRVWDAKELPRIRAAILNGVRPSTGRR